MSIFADDHILAMPSHVRRVIGNYKVDRPEVKMLIQAGKKLKAEVVSPVWLKNGAIAHVGFPKQKVAVQILAQGNRSTEYIREKRNAFAEQGWKLFPLKPNAVFRRGFEGISQDLKEILHV